jgi:hypothetical protein
MKKIILILVSTIIMCNLFAQKENEIGQQKLLQKLVLDIGATPLSTSFGNNPQLTSYNFSIGYQVIKRLDVRLNLDLLNIFEENSEVNNNLNYYEKLLGLSLGIGCNVLKGKEDSFFKNTSLGFVGKFGAGIAPESREQESLFFDISARAHLGKTPYIGLGINHQITDIFMGEDFTSLYFTFGIDF